MKAARILALLWIFCCGVGAQEEDCITTSSKKCPFEAELPDLPRTVEQLHDYCKYGIPYIQCTIKESSSSCDESELVSLKYWKYGLDYMQYLCKRDSQLYEDVVIGLQCMADLLENVIGNEGHVKFMNMTEFSNELSENRFETSPGCLKKFYDVTQLAVKARFYCGERPQRGFIQTLERVKAFLDPCNEDEISKFSFVVKVIEKKINEIM